MKRDFLAVLCVVAVAAAPALADHGMVALAVANLEDGTQMHVTMQYRQGFDDHQFWDFTFANLTWTFSSVGIGSIETGFVSGATSTIDWSAAGTGDPHPFPNMAVDQHTVALDFGGVAGTLTMTVLPDLY